MRNALTMAIAPTASSASSKDLTESIEPILNYSYELRGTVNSTVLVPDFRKLNKWYSLAYETKQESLILLNAIRQMFIDQGQSFNMYINEKDWDYKYLSRLHILSWKLGVKTQYYMNTPKMDITDTCDSCSS
jgi:ribonucleotide reductase alpha subunit